MTRGTPAHDIFGFKITSRQRGAQQAGRSSVWEKRSSRRRRTSLISSLMTSSHSSSLQLLWNNSYSPGFSLVAPPLPFFSCTCFFFLTLGYLTPSAPLSASWDVIMRTPCQRWLVSSVLYRTEHLPPPFFGRSSTFQQCRRRCAVIPATMMQTACLVFSLYMLQLCRSSWGEMKDLRQGKVWGYLSWFPAHLAACRRVPPSPFNW